MSEMKTKSNISEFLAVLFHSRDVAHKAHLNTDSYAQHVALGDFYDSIIELADKFAENWMGANGKKVGNIPMIQAVDADILKALKVHLDVIQKSRDFVEDDSSLQNIIDEIISEYRKVIYKLTFLK